MMKKHLLSDLDFKGQRALIRVDFNVPLTPEGQVADDSRLLASLPTINHILDHGGSVVLMSHLGRPKNKNSREFSLKPVAIRLEELLHKKVIFIPDCMGDDAFKEVQKIQPGEAALLENLRFYPAEEDPSLDPNFAKTLSTYGDFYVNDAFGTAHRAHSSTAEIARFFPGKSAAGLLMQKEIDYLEKLFKNPERPFYAVVGGAKISTKIEVLKALLQKTDALLIGGAMSYTFLKVQGVDVGGSLVETACLDEAKMILEEAEKKKVPLYLPVDHLVYDKSAKDGVVLVATNKEGIAQNLAGMDIGPATIELYSRVLQKAKTIFWNGPMGVFEEEKFAKGTEAIAKAIVEAHALSVVGGGDSLLAVNQLKLQDRFTHLSTGGGATLEWIEKQSLPGIEALTNVLDNK